jgi:hypothetical protein
VISALAAVVLLAGFAHLALDVLERPANRKD